MAKLTSYSQAPDGTLVYAKTGKVVPLSKARALTIKGKTVYDTYTGRRVGAFGKKNMSPTAIARAEREAARTQRAEGPRPYTAAERQATGEWEAIQESRREAPRYVAADEYDLMNAIPEDMAGDFHLRNVAQACRTSVQDGVWSLAEAQQKLDRVIIGQRAGGRQAAQSWDEFWASLNEAYEKKYGFRYSNKLEEERRISRRKAPAPGRQEVLD